MSLCLQITALALQVIGVYGLWKLVWFRQAEIRESEKWKA